MLIRFMAEVLPSKKGMIKSISLLLISLLHFFKIFYQIYFIIAVEESKFVLTSHFKEKHIQQTKIRLFIVPIPGVVLQRLSALFSWHLHLLLWSDLSLKQQLVVCYQKTARLFFLD